MDGERETSGTNVGPSCARPAAMPLLDDCPDPLKTPLAACAEGAVPANIALMRFLMAARDRTEVEGVLDRIEAAIAREPMTDVSERLKRLVALWHDNPQAYALIKTVLADVEHGGRAASDREGIA